MTMKIIQMSSSYRDDVLRDRIIAGMKSKEIKRKFLHKGDELKIKDAIETIKSHKANQSQPAAIAYSSPKVEVDALRTH